MPCRSYHPVPITTGIRFRGSDMFRPLASWEFEITPAESNTSTTVLLCAPRQSLLLHIGAGIGCLVYLSMDMRAGSQHPKQ